MDDTTSQRAIVSDQHGGDVGLYTWEDSWDGEGKVKLLVFSFLQWTLEDFATVLLEAGNFDLQTVDVGEHFDLNFCGVLVGGKVGLQSEWLSLVDDAGVSRTVGQS